MKISSKLIVIVLIFPINCVLVLETAWKATICSSQPDSITLFDNEKSDGTLQYRFFWKGHPQDSCGLNPVIPATKGCCLESLDTTLSGSYTSVMYDSPGNQPLDVLQGSYCHISALEVGSFNGFSEMFIKPSPTCNHNMTCDVNGITVFNNENCAGTGELFLFLNESIAISSNSLGNVSVEFVRVTTGKSSKTFSWTESMPVRYQIPYFNQAFHVFCYIVGCLAIVYAIFKVVKASFLAYYYRSRPYSWLHLIIDVGWLIRSVISMTTWSFVYTNDIDWIIQEQISEMAFNISTLLQVWESIDHIMSFYHVHSLNTWRIVFGGLITIHLLLAGSRYINFAYYGYLGDDVANVMVSWSFALPFWILFILIVDMTVPSFLFYRIISVNAENRLNVFENFVYVGQNYKSFLLLLVVQILNTVVILTYMSIQTYSEVLANDLNHNASFYGLTCFFKILHSDLNTLIIRELRVIYKKSAKQFKSSKNLRTAQKGSKLVLGTNKSEAIIPVINGDCTPTVIPTVKSPPELSRLKKAEK